MDLLRNDYVLDLTFYEVGNALWRIHAIQKKLSLEEIRALIDATTDLANWMNRVSISDLNLLEIMEAAVRDDITFYDAAYVTAAKLRKLMLVTDDAKLARVASKYVKVKGSKDF